MSDVNDQMQPLFLNGAVAYGMIGAMTSLFLGAAALVGLAPETQARACAWWVSPNTTHDPSPAGNGVDTSILLSIEQKDFNHT